MILLAVSQKTDRRVLLRVAEVPGNSLYSVTRLEAASNGGIKTYTHSFEILSESLDSVTVSAENVSKSLHRRVHWVTLQEFVMGLLCFSKTSRCPRQVLASAPDIVVISWDDLLAIEVAEVSEVRSATSAE